MKPANGLFLLIDYSLRSADNEADRLAIYDAVRAFGVPLAEKMADGESAEIALIVLKAASASEAIRMADKAQLEFAGVIKGVRE